MLASFIDVASTLQGEGTAANPWQIHQAQLESCVRQLTWNRKTIYFRAGQYRCSEPIQLDFGALFPSEEDRAMLREGVRFLGEARASVLQFDCILGRGPLFRVWWSRPRGAPMEFQVPLFFWEFSGLSFKGECDCAMVEFGGADVEETPWNSCDFQLSVNNGYMAHSPHTGPARGIVIRRALESSIYLVATCAKGMGAVLDLCEFCTIRGSFSNAEEDMPIDHAHCPTGKGIAYAGIGLYMRNCCSNTGLAVNFEVAFTGLRLDGACRGNVFNSIISNNCDVRGTVINDDDCDEMDEETNNLVHCLVLRQARQGGGQLQRHGSHPSKISIVVCKS